MTRCHRLLRGFLVAICVAGLAIPSLDHASASTTPTVANGGFEEPVSDGAIPGWRQTYGSTPAFTVVDEPVHTGSRSVRMVDTSTSASVGLQSDRFAVSTEVTYTFTAAVYIETGLPRMYAYFYDSSGRQLSATSAAVRGGTGSWVTGSVTATAPAGATHAAILLYSAVGGVTTAYFDDVSVGRAPGTETNLGTPIHNVAVTSAAYGTTPDGREVTYLAMNGDPAVIAAVDSHTGALVAATRLPGAGGAWALTVAPDGSVYAGSYPNGALYRWVPGEGAAALLGAPLPGESFIWELVTDDEGNVYGGTYPSGKVFRYDSSTGRVHDYGQLKSDSQYVRSLAWSRGKVYAGLGTERAHLIELDPSSGATREIALPGDLASATEVYDLDAYRHFLFVRTSGPSNLVVYDQSAGEWSADLGATAGLGVSPPGPKNKVYYIKDGTLTSYDLATGKVTSTGFADLWSARRFGWVHLDKADYPGQTLVTADFIGRLRLYNPRTGAHQIIESDAPGQPTALHSVAVGPDDRVYVTGYQSGGLAVYDPRSGALDQYPRGTVGQAEGMLSAYDRLWLGIYPGAHVLEFDPTKPFDYGTNPAEPFSLGAYHQDRPFALTAVAGRVAVGTVPDYGKLGGALALYDPSTGALDTHRNIVPDQSIVSLTSKDNIVYGGTSVWGGLGTPPTARDGVVFAWDTTTDEKLWQTRPIAGERAVTALTMGPNGNLWGITVGTLFEMDPTTGTVLRTKELYPFSYEGVSHVWTSGAIATSGDGMLYANVLGHLLRIDPTTLEATELTTDAHDMALASDGAIYYYRGTDLYRYTLDERSR